jgi:Fe-S oxidoreductase
MDENLRLNRAEKNEVQTIQDFQIAWVFWAAEKCNGSEIAGNRPQLVEVCPSYRATLNEKDTTRARANALREYLTHSEKDNKFNHKELYDVLSCVWAVKLVPANVQVMWMWLL